MAGGPNTTAHERTHRADLARRRKQSDGKRKGEGNNKGVRVTGIGDKEVREWKVWGGGGGGGGKPEQLREEKRYCSTLRGIQGNFRLSQSQKIAQPQALELKCLNYTVENICNKINYALFCLNV